MKKICSYLLGCSLFFAACGPLIKVVEVESLMPAKYPVAYSDKSIAILNALKVNNFDGTINYSDSLLTNLASMGLKEGMEADNLFSGYDIPVYNLLLNCTNNQCEELADTEYMNSIAEQTESALLIVVDTIEIAQAEQIIGQISVDNWSYWSYWGYYGSNKAFYAVTFVPYKALFRYYDAEQQRYLVNYEINDTIRWEAAAYKATEALTKVPEVAEANTLAAEQVGKLMAKATLPYWKSDKRYFYELSGGKGYAATTGAEKRDWKQAMYYWGQIAMEAKGKTAAYAAFNMALGCEMLGEYPLAIEWLTVARNKADLPEINGYVKRLQQRIADKKLIEQQLTD